jgi:short-subunit dehydrogenase
MHVIVTGGSSGIGLAIAEIYAARGAEVSLIARDADRLSRAQDVIVSRAGVHAGSIHLQSADVASETEVAAAIAACEARFGPCDVLIASAGIVEPGAFDQIAIGAFAEQININLLGTAYAVHAVYKGMAARQSGSIMMISSGAALIGIYGYTGYCASKSALAGFAEALSAEAARSGVAISIAFPPDTLTPQYHREMTMRPREAALLMGTVKPWPAGDVAAKIVHAVDRKRAKVYFGFSIAALAYLGPIIKPLLMWWFFRRLKNS